MEKFEDKDIERIFKAIKNDAGYVIPDADIEYINEMILKALTSHKGEAKWVTRIWEGWQILVVYINYTPYMEKEKTVYIAIEDKFGGTEKGLQDIKDYIEELEYKYSIS